jgi:hypothetical protein
VVLPIVWFEEWTSGGLAGGGTGEPAKDLTALDAFGPWAIAIAAAAVLPVAAWFARRTLSGGARLAVAALVIFGLGVLAVGTIIELDESTPVCCDQIYATVETRWGLWLGLAGAGLVAAGSTLGWVATWRLDPRL